MRIEQEEKTIQMMLEMQERYARKRPFGEKPLKAKDFSDKYWLKGTVPYQYHTVSIQDGRDELEQLILNDIRSIKNDTVKDRMKMLDCLEMKQEKINECKKEIADVRKSVTICKITSAIAEIAIVLAICLLHSQKNI